MLRMDPATPTSFIPKRPIVNEPVSEIRNTRSIGLFSLLTFVIVISVGLSYAGLYLYQKQLTDQIATLDTSIGDAKNELGSQFLVDMKRLNDRIEGVKSLIKTHVVISPIFEALQTSTLRSVQYKTFGYNLVTDSLTNNQTVSVTLTGVSKSYSTIALQSDAFESNNLIKNPVFSNLSINDKSGSIEFKLVFDVDINDLSFQSFVDALQKNAPIINSTIET